MGDAMRVKEVKEKSESGTESKERENLIIKIEWVCCSREERRIRNQII